MIVFHYYVLYLKLKHIIHVSVFNNAQLVFMSHVYMKIKPHKIKFSCEDLSSDELSLPNIIIHLSILYTKMPPRYYNNQIDN